MPAMTIPKTRPSRNPNPVFHTTTCPFPPCNLNLFNPSATLQGTSSSQCVITTTTCSWPSRPRRYCLAAFTIPPVIPLQTSSNNTTGGWPTSARINKTIRCSPVLRSVNLFDANSCRTWWWDPFFGDDQAGGPRFSNISWTRAFCHWRDDSSSSSPKAGWLSPNRGTKTPSKPVSIAWRTVIPGWRRGNASNSSGETTPIVLRRWGVGIRLRWLRVNWLEW